MSKQAKRSAVDRVSVDEPNRRPFLWTTGRSLQVRSDKKRTAPESDEVSSTSCTSGKRQRQYLRRIEYTSGCDRDRSSTKCLSECFGTKIDPSMHPPHRLVVATKQGVYEATHSKKTLPVVCEGYHDRLLSGASRLVEALAQSPSHSPAMTKASPRVH